MPTSAALALRPGLTSLKPEAAAILHSERDTIAPTARESRMNSRIRMALTGASLAWALALWGCAAPQADRSGSRVVQALVHDTSLALDTVVDEGDRPLLRSALRDACAVLVFPHMRGGGFFAGWSGGAGLLMQRNPAGPGWSGPAFFSMGDMTLGPEVSLSSWELIVVFQRCDALEPLRHGERTFSFRTSLARQAAEDEAGIAVEPGIRAFARSQGAVVGLSVHFVELHAEDGLTAACYGHALSTTEALGDDGLGNAAVRAMRRTMERVTR